MVGRLLANGWPMVGHGWPMVVKGAKGGAAIKNAFLEKTPSQKRFGRRSHSKTDILEKIYESVRFKLPVPT